MLFSERMGFKKIEEIILTDTISISLRNRLKNIIYRIFELASENKDYHSSRGSEWVLYRFLIENFLKEDIQSWKNNRYHFSAYYEDIVIEIDSMEWYSYYDILELLGKNGLISEDLFERINFVLKEEKSGYRLTKDFKFLPITDQIALSTIDSVSISKFSHAKEHIQKALNELSEKESVDYNSVIRESINSVESCFIEVAEMSPSKKNTLGQAVKRIEQLYPNIEISFLKPFEHLYGMASNNGIRHAGNDKTIKSDISDVILVLTTCSAVINYLSFKTGGQ